MRFFIAVLLSLVCVAQSQVPGPNGKNLDIIFEPVEVPAHDSEFSDYMFLFSLPTDQGVKWVGVNLWQLNELDEHNGLQTLPGYYMHTVETKRYYRLKILVEAEEIPEEDYLDFIEFLQKSFFYDPDYQIKQDQDGTWRAVPLPIQ